MSVMPMPNPPGGASASAVVAALKANGATHVVTVPDFVQFALHEWCRAPGIGLTNILACSEDQVLTTACGLYIGGAKPVVLMQNQGLYKCMNTLRAVCIDAGVPLVFLVGQFGRELENFGQPMTESRRSMVRLMEPVLDAMGVRHWAIDDDAEVPRLAEAFAHAEAKECAAVALFGRHVAWN